ncbi:MAG: DNA topoisomerase 4 subunit A, partial [Lachnospiraceae bacterium]|nr:DNA topoisomerase 4 subunit A [Lachnospiraceae bacterium]
DVAVPTQNETLVFCLWNARHCFGAGIDRLGCYERNIKSVPIPHFSWAEKTVQRRILYAMSELGLSPDKPHRKSARIVGDTMGKYHPHGDSSIYEALVHMSEDYSLSLPLVDGHGNFGSIDGDGAAAMRYTEAKLSFAAQTMLSNLEKGLIDFVPNFDNSENEPTVLPATFPNLLINGTTGIAVGMATNIPPHNPCEVIDGMIAFIDNPNITLDKLMTYIKGPDFPTGGIIINSSAIKGIYETGEGRLRVRAKSHIEEGEGGRKNIIITEIPYTAAGNKSKLIEGIVTLMRDKVFDEIYDVRDESSKDGIRIIIEVKKDRDPENLLNGLYKKSSLEDTYSVNMLAVKEQQPIVFTLKSMINEFVKFQQEIYTKEYTFLLNKAKNRIEVLEGLIKATDIIDLIIEIIRGSRSVKQVKACLTTGDITDIKFKHESSKKEAMTLSFTEVQADAILAMPLSRLVGLEIEKLNTELLEITKNADEYNNILSNEKELFKVIKNRLKSYKKQFTAERKTAIDEIENAVYKEEVKIEDLYILIDKFGYTKSVDITSFSKASEDSLKEYAYVIQLRSDDKLCMFTSKGTMYQIKASSIPKCRLKEKGTLIHSLCRIGNEDIITYASFEELFESQLVFITKKGLIKRVSGTEFETSRYQMSASKLDDSDKVVEIVRLSASQVLSGNMKVFVLTKKNLVLAFVLEEIPELRKTSKGVKSISLDADDHVDAMKILDYNEETFTYKNKTYHSKKIRTKKRAQKGNKLKEE